MESSDNTQEVDHRAYYEATHTEATICDFSTVFKLLGIYSEPEKPEPPKKRSHKRRTERNSESNSGTHTPPEKGASRDDKAAMSRSFTTAKTAGAHAELEGSRHRVEDRDRDRERDRDRDEGGIKRESEVERAEKKGFNEINGASPTISQLPPSPPQLQTPSPPGYNHRSAASTSTSTAAAPSSSTSASTSHSTPPINTISTSNGAGLDSGNQPVLSPPSLSLTEPTAEPTTAPAPVPMSVPVPMLATRPASGSVGGNSSARDLQLNQFERVLATDGLEVAVYLTSREGETKNKRAVLRCERKSTTVYCEIKSKRTNEPPKRLKFDLIADVMMVSRGKGAGRGKNDAKVPATVDEARVLHFTLRGKPELNVELDSAEVRDSVLQGFMGLISRQRNAASSSGRAVP